jgi:predicted dinucleotide-binding enzyme
MSAPASSSAPSSGRLQIGFLGAGNIGTALARHFARLGHEVLLSNSRGPETLKDKAAELGVKAVTSAEAAKAKDFVVLTVPQLFLPRLKPLLDAAQPSNAVIIDTCNYYPDMRDGHIPELDESGIDSVWTSKQIGRPVIKVTSSNAVEPNRGPTLQQELCDCLS